MNNLKYVVFNVKIDLKRISNVFIEKKVLVLYMRYTWCYILFRFAVQWDICTFNEIMITTKSYHKR